MEYVVPGLCGLLLIVGIVAAVMARSIWRIPQILLVILILIGSLVFFYQSARVMKMRQNWENEITAFNKQIDLVQKGRMQGDKVLDPGLDQLRIDRRTWGYALNLAQQLRGRVWSNATRFRVTPEGVITAVVDQPAGIERGAVLYVFEDAEKERGGKYLGQFTVTEIHDKQITLTPGPSMVQSELNTIAASHGPWSLYEIMPVDSHTLFAQYDPQAIKLLMPREVVTEYLRDGKAAQASDPPENVWLRLKFTKEWPSAAAPKGPGPAQQAQQPEGHFKPGDTRLFDPATANDLIKQGVAVINSDAPDHGKVYVRPLRAYAMIFGDQYRRRTKLFAQRDEVRLQAEHMTNSLKESQEDVAAATSEKEGLTSDLAQFKVELEAVTKFTEACEGLITRLRTQVHDTFVNNLKMDAQLATMQKRLLEAINRRNPPDTEPTDPDAILNR